MLNVLQDLRDAAANGHVHPTVAKAILALADRLAPADAEAEPDTAKGGE